MHNSLHNLKVAVLVGNGFDEASYMEMRRVWKDCGASVSLVSANPGLVNSWRDDDWGLNYPADFHLSSALAADFDILLVLGGRPGIDKLMTTAHTKRFLSGFIGASKPVVMMDEALDLLDFAAVDGYSVAKEAGSEVDGMLFTAVSSDETLADIMQAGQDFVISHMSVAEAA